MRNIPFQGIFQQWPPVLRKRILTLSRNDSEVRFCSSSHRLPVFCMIDRYMILLFSEGCNRNQKITSQKLKHDIKIRSDATYPGTVARKYKSKIRRRRKQKSFFTFGLLNAFLFYVIIIANHEKVRCCV